MTTQAELEKLLGSRLDEIWKTTRFFPLPAPGFDPLTASPEQLVHYGLPAKPDADLHPALYAFWHRLFSPPLRFREVNFTLSDQPFPSASTRQQATPSFRTSHEKSRNWSGAYISARRGQIFTQIHGAWRVPAPVPPPATPTTGTHEFRSSTWVGLDGQRSYYHSSLPQIGTAQTVKSAESATQQTAHFAWWQWWVRGDFSQPPVVLSLAVDSGDLIMSSVIVEPDRKSVRFIIKNATTGHIVGPFVRAAPAQAVPLEVSGATAQWIMERPAVWPTDVLYDLPDYGAVLFDDCLAVAANPRGGPSKERNLEGAKLIHMYEVRRSPQRTATISAAKLVNERQVMTAYR